MGQQQLSECFSSLYVQIIYADKITNFNTPLFFLEYLHDFFFRNQPFLLNYKNFSSTWHQMIYWALPAAVLLR